MPPDWTSTMRRMAVAYDYFRRVARGDIPAKDNESSKEDDDTKPDDEDEDEFE